MKSTLDQRREAISRELAAAKPKRRRQNVTGIEEYGDLIRQASERLSYRQIAQILQPYFPEANTLAIVRRVQAICKAAAASSVREPAEAVAGGKISDAIPTLTEHIREAYDPPPPDRRSINREDLL